MAMSRYAEPSFCAGGSDAIKKLAALLMLVASSCVGAQAISRQCMPDWSTYSCDFSRLHSATLDATTGKDWWAVVVPFDDALMSMFFTFEGGSTAYDFIADSKVREAYRYDRREEARQRFEEFDVMVQEYASRRYISRSDEARIHRLLARVRVDMKERKAP